MNSQINELLKELQTNPVPEQLALADFATLFGTTEADVAAKCGDQIAEKDFTYHQLTADARDRVALYVLKAVDSGTLTLAGKEAKPRWEKGWAENLEEFLAQGYDTSKLVPRYIRQAQPLRLNQNYVLPTDSNFEMNWYAIFRNWFFKTYLNETANIYEFGCGSGFNLVVLANLFPEKRLIGLDWAAPSRDIVKKLAMVYGWKMEGYLFDFFSPDPQVKIAPDSAVLTIGALEQTGTNYEPFLQFLLKQQPVLCAHLEPICEWYEEDKIVDYLAVRFHKYRNYWQGFPNRLKQLEQEGKVEIFKMKRSYFGSLFLEGYSQILWRPRRK